MNALSWKNIVIAILVVLNIAALSTIWLKGSKAIDQVQIEQEHHRPKGPEHRPGMKPPGPLDRVFRQELNFSEEQLKQFRTIKEAHLERTKALHDNNKKLKEALFKLVSSEDDAKAEEIVEEMGQNQQLIEKETYDHFKSIRAICDDKQKEKFDVIINEISERFDRKGPQRPHHP